MRMGSIRLWPAITHWNDTVHAPVRRCMCPSRPSANCPSDSLCLPLRKDIRKDDHRLVAAGRAGKAITMCQPNCANVRTGSPSALLFFEAVIVLIFFFLSLCMLSRSIASLFFRSSFYRRLSHSCIATVVTATHLPPFLSSRRLSLYSISTRHIMTSSSSSTVNPGTLFKSPVRAIWNIQGENVPTLWWSAKTTSADQLAHKGSEPHTVFFMLPGTAVCLTSSQSYHLENEPMQRRRYQ